MSKYPESTKQLSFPQTFSFLFIFLLFYSIRQYNFLVFHSLIEIVTVMVGGGIFFFTWSTKKYIENDFFYYLGISLAFVAGLDFLHILAYEGIGVFKYGGTNLATQFWIAARYFQSITLLHSTQFINKKVSREKLIISLAIIFFLIIYAILIWNIFPITFYEDTGLTFFKKISEYLISTILLIVIYKLIKAKNHFNEKVLKFVIISLVMMIFTELVFTLYLDVFGWIIFFGHIFKVISMYYLYSAVIIVGLKQPISILFYEISEKEKKLQAIYDSREKELALLNTITSIFSSFSEDESVEIIIQNALQEIISYSEVVGAECHLLNQNNELKLVSTWGLSANFIKESQEFVFTSDSEVPGLLFTGKKAIFIEDVQNEEIYLRKDLAQKYGYRSILCVPIIRNEKVLGTFMLYSEDKVGFSEQMRSLLVTSGEALGSAIHRIELFQGLKNSKINTQKAYNSTIEGWAKALEARDIETVGHSRRVTNLALNLAKQFKLDKDDIESIYRGSLLHDVGKMGIPDNILYKDMNLSDDDWKIMKTHPTLAYQWLNPMGFLDSALDIPYYHHEKWDGSGYPQGISGKDIPFSARLFAIVDVYDALTSDRSYRNAWPKEKVLKYIEFESGKHFDPMVVKVFLKLIKTYKT